MGHHLSADSSDLAQDRELAIRLRQTWMPFFGRFGRLRPAQRQAMPGILDGRDTLIIAPTASGKTEAACAPLVERYAGGRPWMILYISPTRALVNDLYARLSGPLRQMGLTIGRRTSDHKDGLRDNPNILITTPESFDSMLCRGRGPSGHYLGNVVAVVLDEVHLVYGTARGEQIRWLVDRLRRIREQARDEGLIKDPTVQVVALSATVPDSDAVARAYLADDAQTVSAGAGRQIEVVTADADLPGVEHALPALLGQRDDFSKILVFSNSRKRVDELARELGRSLASHRYEVVAHHGSLSLGEREHAERRLKEADRVVVCATMTLEIGIDIGDVDLVVLDSPAPSVSSLLQRVGRGNRRSSKTCLMMCSGSVVEALIHAAMLASAREGRLGSGERGPQYAVTRQQIASYIFQGSRIERPRAQIERFVGRLAPELDAAELLSHLVDRQEFKETLAGVQLGEHWEEQTTRGDIHSNIEDVGGYNVVDDRTGTKIATGIRSQAGRGMGVAGKLLEVRRWDQFSIIVRGTKSDARAEGEWSYVSQAWMYGAGQPEAVRDYLGIDERTWPYVTMGDLRCVFHFGGSRRRAVLELAAEFGGAHGVRQVDNWCIWLDADTFTAPSGPAWTRSWTPAQVQVSMGSEEMQRLEQRLARPRANRSLPMKVRAMELAGWLQLPSELEAAKASEWTPAAAEATRGALTAIASSLQKNRRGGTG